jgi:hypothetical protein
MLLILEGGLKPGGGTKFPRGAPTNEELCP